ncbi:MAG: hypothetical protein SWY16_17770 [Cyanobacteriota bacterium]|nr:hypothetical protein [Cyanobacteriota bacterium]
MQVEIFPVQLDRLEAEFHQYVESNLGLAGLNKIEMPPFYSQELQTYRQSQTDRNIAPFLGYWGQEWGQLFPPHSSLSVFPSTTENSLCIIEEIYDYGEYNIAPRERRTLSVNFELVSVENGGAIGTRYILDRRLITTENNPIEGEEETEFLGVVLTQTGELDDDLYASSGIPVYENPNPDIDRQFAANGCISG